MKEPCCGVVLVWCGCGVVRLKIYCSDQLLPSLSPSLPLLVMDVKLSRPETSERDTMSLIQHSVQVIITHYQPTAH